LESKRGNWNTHREFNRVLKNFILKCRLAARIEHVVEMEFFRTKGTFSAWNEKQCGELAIWIFFYWEEL
jgi:hypothetical protein